MTHAESISSERLIHYNQAVEVRRRLLDEAPLDEEELEAAGLYYEAVFVDRTKGPQLEGLTTEGVHEALQDPRTVAVRLTVESGEITWPLLVPVEYNAEYRPGFFADHFGEGAENRVFYFSDPGDMGSGRIDLDELANQGAVIVCDYQEGVDTTTRPHLETMVSRAGVQLHEEIVWDPKAGRPKVLHFSGYASQIEADPNRPTNSNLQEVFLQKVAAGEYERYPEHGVTLLSPEDIATNINGYTDDILAMYDDQFTRLIEYHPSMQAQTRESLLGALSDEDTLSVASMKDGHVIGLCFFVRTIEKCEWLDSKFYKEKYPGEQLAYFPGIVVDQANEGQTFSFGMVRFITELLAAGNQDLRVLFQCTNRSALYILRIVDLAVNRGGFMKFGDQAQLAAYRYDMFRVEKVAPQAGEVSPRLAA